ncbi:hypothetical protein ACHAQA_001198 [Verticillium albo-atrum]
MPQITTQDNVDGHVSPRQLVPSSEHAEGRSLAHPHTSVPFTSYGFSVLHPCPDAVVDICFIHGLTGGRETTWTAEGQPEPWPKTLLPPKLPKARILSYGYDAYIFAKGGGVSTNGLADHAKNFLTDLTTERASSGAKTRPLIFVAHSLGGLVCKEAILLSRDSNDEHLRGVFDHVSGIAFMGTPHKGSWMVDWANIPVSALGVMPNSNIRLLGVLKTTNEFLESVQERFCSMLHARRQAIQVTCFFEELTFSSAVGSIVPKDSATLDGYAKVSIHKNHRDMVRFESADDNDFKRLLGELQRWVSQAANAATGPSTGREDDDHAKPSNTHYGSGNQYNTSGHGVTNHSQGEGRHFNGSTFSGNVSFS